MCKLIIGIRNKSKEKSDIRKMLIAQENIVKKEQDGIAGMVLSGNKVQIERSLDEYEKIQRWVQQQSDKADMVVLHSRTSTSGGINIDNVHLFQKNDWVFAHNGFVGAFNRYSYNYNGGMYNRNLGFDTGISNTERRISNLCDIIESCTVCGISENGYCAKHKNAYNTLQSLQEQQLNAGKSTEKGKEPYSNDITMCDSYNFLANLPKKINIETLTEYVDETSFSGMGFLLNKKTLEKFLLVFKKSYCVRGNGFSMFFSFEPSMTLVSQEIEEIHGISVEGIKRTDKLEFQKQEIYEGVYKITV